MLLPFPAPKFLGLFIPFLDVASKQKSRCSQFYQIEGPKRDRATKDSRDRRCLSWFQLRGFLGSHIPGRAAGNQTSPSWAPLRAPAPLGCNLLSPKDRAVTPEMGYLWVIIMKHLLQKMCEQLLVYPDQKLNFCIWETSKGVVQAGFELLLLTYF